MRSSHRRAKGAPLLAVTLLAATALVAAACTPPPVLSASEQVDQIVAFVEQARGHEFPVEPTVEFMEPAAFEAEVLANLAAEEPEIAGDEATFVALDWMDASEDLVDEYRATYGGGVVGFYDPTSQALKVRGTTLTPYRREVIAHELTHALDDQIHDLGDLDPDGLVDDVYLGALVAVEGSAERIRAAYYASMSPLEQLESLQEQLNAGSVPDLLEVPVTLLTLTTAPYLRGATFQAEIVAALGNPQGPDESLDRYPATTEQAFDTAKYLADEPAVAVPAPPTEGGAPVVRSDTAGPLMLSLALREGLVLDALDPLTAAWAGGSYTTWYDGTSACIRIDTIWDSAGAAAAIATAFSAWGDLHGGTTIATPDTDQVRLLRCD